MGRILALAQPLDGATVPANTVVTLPRRTIYDFDRLPGKTIAVRVAARVSAADPPGQVKVTTRILTATELSETVIRSDSLLCPTVGLNTLITEVYSKPSGLQLFDAQVAMDTAGTSGAFDDLEVVLELNDPSTSQLWNFWLPTSFMSLYGATEGQGSVTADSGIVGCFDFGQIPIGATVRLVLAGRSRDAVTNFWVKVSELADYANIAGDIVLSGSYPAGTGLGKPFSAAGSFINVYDAPKLIKVTGRTPGGGSGGVGGASLVMMH
jgi:hypothetical protein